MLTEKSIIIVGSTNTDMVVSTKHFPAPGETILGGDFFINLGGKGANQAVAAARLGASVTFMSKVGNDIFGTQAIEQLYKENIDVSLVETDSTASSGIALITVDEKGENTIVVAPGANANLKIKDTRVLDNIITEDSMILMQLECPIETIEVICKYAKSKNAQVILNPAPAPAEKLPASILATLSLITPNQTEAELISGIVVHDESSAQKAAQKIHELGPETVVITMGSIGAYVSSNEEAFFLPAYKVQAVDTTAAGDVFNGALVVSLSQGKSLKESVQFASKAAAISVTRRGAQASAPTYQEVIDSSI